MISQGSISLTPHGRRRVSGPHKQLSYRVVTFTYVGLNFFNAIDPLFNNGWLKLDNVWLAQLHYAKPLE